MRENAVNTIGGQSLAALIGAVFGLRARCHFAGRTVTLSWSFQLRIEQHFGCYGASTSFGFRCDGNRLFVQIVCRELCADSLLASILLAVAGLPHNASVACTAIHCMAWTTFTATVFGRLGLSVFLASAIFLPFQFTILGCDPGHSGRNRSKYGLQRGIILLASLAVIVFDVLRLLFRNVNAVAVVPFFATIAATVENVICY